jgi:BlaI family transcriptional regulator, penicillinase repressor
MKTLSPSNLEMQVLALLWDHGPLSARSVLERMRDGKPRAYTTILSVLQVMERKGLVRHETEGNRHVYVPKVKRQSVVRPLLRGLIKTILGGCPSAAMQHLLDSSEITEGDLAEMRQVLDNYEKRERK